MKELFKSLFFLVFLIEFGDKGWEIEVFLFLSKFFGGGIEGIEESKVVVVFKLVQNLNTQHNIIIYFILYYSRFSSSYLISGWSEVINGTEYENIINRNSLSSLLFPLLIHFDVFSAQQLREDGIFLILSDVMKNMNKIQEFEMLFHS